VPNLQQRTAPCGSVGDRSRFHWCRSEWLLNQAMHSSRKEFFGGRTVVNGWGGNRYHIHAGSNERVDFGIALAAVLFHHLLATIGTGVNHSHQIASLYLRP
jgi:hypothetical protein